ncbi:MAG: isocitrate lyase/phosphoenolpyruvate mutase family protein [Candidatus Dormibacteraeota bacterium]|nr:isocitrate lyase/phosphoenolpyruvate mutase family protein [Candidatus Dormibacteraeota bacterium]
MAALRLLDTPGDYAVGVGVHSAITARIAERTGFEVLWLSGLEVSAERALPDLNVITLTEMAAELREVVRASRLPVFVDGDNGYGSDELMLRAAGMFAEAGATAMCVEDNEFPKRNSFYTGVERSLEDIRVFARRLELVRVRVPQLKLIARTEALVVGLGADEAVSRARAYADSGADAVFIQTLTSTVAEFESVLERLRGTIPIMVTPTKMPGVLAADLHRMGADVIIYSNVVMRTVIASLERCLADLRRAERLSAVFDQMAHLERLFELTSTDDWLLNVVAPHETELPSVAAGGAM